MVRIILLSLALIFITGTQSKGQGDIDDGGGDIVIIPDQQVRFVPKVMVY